MATYYVRNGGSDSNDGLSDANAFATPQKAYDVSIPGDIILLKRSSVWNTILNLNKNTATEFNPIQFQSYGDAELPKPEISGAKVLTGWVNVGNGLYRYTDSEITVRINLLTLDGSCKPKGMLPRGDDYFRATGATGSQSGTLTDTVRISTFSNLTGAEVISRKEHWILDRGIVTSHSGNTINFEGMGVYNMRTNWGYKLQNQAQFCTELGDWYQDGDNVYVYFGSENPNDYDVRISFRPHCVNVNGTGKYTYFENINFTYYNGRENESGNDFGPSFYFQNSPGHKFTSCNFRFFGRMVFYHYMSPLLEVSFCTVEDVMDNFWFNRFGNNQGTDLKLHRCQIRRIGAIHGAGGNGDGRYTAFHTSQVGDRIEVTDNLFEDIGYNGVAIGGYNYLVQNNLFLRCNIVKDDGGCIYTFKGTTNVSFNKNNRKILRNICLDSPGAPKGKQAHFDNPSYTGAGKGIYVDDNQVLSSPDNITIWHNIATGCGDGMMSHNNEGLDIQYNTLYNNNDYQFKSQDDNLGVVANRNNTFKNNICYANEGQYAMIVHAVDGLYIHGDWDNNYYMRPSNEDGLIRTTTNSSEFVNRSLSNWKTLGNDANSKGTPTTSTLSELVINHDFDTITYTPTRVKLDVYGLEVEEPFYLLPFQSKLLLDDLGPVDPIPTDEYTITLVSAAGGIATGGGIYEEGDTATLEALPDTDYEFDGWSEGGSVVSTSNPWAFVVNGDRTITPVFAEVMPPPAEYTVTVIAGTGGSVSGGGTYEDGEQATVTATPNPGWHFVRWSNDVTDNPYSFTVTGDVTLQAIFAQDEPLPGVIIVKGKFRIV